MYNGFPLIFLKTPRKTYKKTADGKQYTETIKIISLFKPPLRPLSQLNFDSLANIKTRPLTNGLTTDLSH